MNKKRKIHSAFLKKGQEPKGPEKTKTKRSIERKRKIREGVDFVWSLEATTSSERTGGT
jgi:hypothetical protein